MVRPLVNGDILGLLCQTKADCLKKVVRMNLGDILRISGKTRMGGILGLLGQTKADRVKAVVRMDLGDI